MRQFPMSFGICILVVVTEGALAAQPIPNDSPEVKGKLALARTRLRSAQDAATGAINNLKRTADELKERPDDPEARRNFQVALTKTLDARKNLLDARKQMANAGLAEKGDAKPARPAPQDQRFVRVHNETSKPVTIRIQVYSKTDAGTWTWLPAGAAKGDAPAAYRLGAGQISYLGHKGQKLTGSKIRFSVAWQGGEFTRYRTRDFWLVPEVDAAGNHVYYAPATETFPLRLTP